MIDDMNLLKNNSKYTGTLEITISDFQAKTRAQANIYLKELLVKLIKQAVITQYPMLEQIVDETIRSTETKELIQKTIREEISKMVQNQVKEIFGESHD